jgi:hypothetical protein
VARGEVHAEDGAFDAAVGVQQEHLGGGAGVVGEDL